MNAVLPRWHAQSPLPTARLKVEPADFVVEEIPAYEPSGTGEHLFLWVEKRDVSAELLTRHVARALEISQKDIGVAGLKDRRAVTRQYLSIPARAQERIGAIETDQIRVLRSACHGNKLKIGHSRGNRFTVLLRDVPPDAIPQLHIVAAAAQARGVPNYYGEQRFGQEGSTLQLGLDLLTGVKHPRDIPYSRREFLLRLSLSAVQSQLFNQSLAQRLQDGLLDRVLPGDVMEVTASGGKFVAEDAAIEQPRLDQGEIVVTGPMFGLRMRAAEGVPGEREAEILSASGLADGRWQDFAKLLSGTRRPYVVRVPDLTCTPADQGVVLEFSLPAGAYATMLVREFVETSAESDSSGGE